MFCLRRCVYFIVHLHIYMGRLCRLGAWGCPQITAAVRLPTWTSLRSTQSICYASNITLISALSLGLYIRWLHSDDIAIVLIAFLGLLIFVAATTLVFYFSLDALAFSLLRLWIGCLEGVVGFTGSPRYEDGTEKTVVTAMNVILILSVCLRLAWTLLDRIFHASAGSFPPTGSNHGFQLIDPMDCLEVLGFASSSLVVGKDILPASLVVFGLLATVSVVRVRSCLGLVHLAAMITLSIAVFYPRLLRVPMNFCTFASLITRISFSAVVDLYFCGLSALQRWEHVLVHRRSVHRLALLCLVVLHFTFIIIYAFNISSHKEWYIVVPIFAGFAAVWCCYHIVFFLTCWLFINKLSSCVSAYRGGGRSGEIHGSTTDLRRIMSSKGLRYFGLVARRVVLITVITSVLVGIVAWETMTALSVGVWAVVLPAEIAVLSLMSDLVGDLGGTCVGYALITPAVLHRPQSPATVLSPNVVQDVTSHSTRILNAVQRFFSYHLIDVFGCDYSSGGQSLEGIQVKLKLFFQRVTTDGPRYDTYVLYYSGPVYPEGDWALTGGARLSLDTLMTWWQAADAGCTSRLVLILDTDSSYRWVDVIRKQRQVCIAIQSWRHVNLKLLNGVDPELGRTEVNNKGSETSCFTVDWIDYNTGNANRTDWRHSSRSMRAVYSVSRAWTDFSFRHHSTEELSLYWDANFPRATRLLVRGAGGLGALGGVGCGCGDCLARCIRRKRMAWLPPIECDTGHGFKLIRSLVN